MTEHPNTRLYPLSTTPFNPSNSWWVGCGDRQLFNRIAAVEFERMRYSRFGRSSGLTEFTEHTPGLAEAVANKKRFRAI